MSPEQFITTAGGGALGVVAIYLCKICLALVKQKATPPPPSKQVQRTTTIPTRHDHEEIVKIYAEIENSKEDRRKMLDILGKSYGLIKDLHEMHDQRDEDGVLKWLNKPSIEREIKRIGRILDDLRKRDRGSRGSGEYSFPIKKE